MLLSVVWQLTCGALRLLVDVGLAPPWSLRSGCRLEADCHRPRLQQSPTGTKGIKNPQNVARKIRKSEDNAENPSFTDVKKDYFVDSFF